LVDMSRLAWPWYVPLGTALTVAAGLGLSLLPSRGTASRHGAEGAARGGAAGA